jgi:methyl-accepting chemotaxis protein
VTELEVQTDHHKCDLGEMLYGAKRREAELVPAFAPLLQNLEAPHQRLHESAIRIKET